MLWLSLRASRAAACRVLAATLAFAQLRLHPLLCGVNSRGAIIAGNHLHTLLRSERRAKHLFRLALRPPDWPTCGDVNTHSSVSQKDAIRSAGGSNYLSRDWKWGEMPAVVSTHISTQETDRRSLFPVDSPSHTHIRTYMQSSSLFMHLLSEPWSPCWSSVRGSVCVCEREACWEFLSYIWMSQTDACVALKKERQNWEKNKLHSC